VDQVVQLLSKHNFFLKHSKCSFRASEVEYLGHIIDKDGVHVDPKKIEAMKDWPHPKILKSYVVSWVSHAIITSLFRIIVKFQLLS
jgi:hypothetical protein